MFSGTIFTNINANHRAPANSVTELDPSHFFRKNIGEDDIIGTCFLFGENPESVRKCIEIKVNVKNDWEIENIKKSIEYGVFLKRYCLWLKKRGVDVLQNEDIIIKLQLGEEELLVHSQKTPYMLSYTNGENVIFFIFIKPVSVDVNSRIIFCSSECYSFLCNYLCKAHQQFGKPFLNAP